MKLQTLSICFAFITIQGFSQRITNVTPQTVGDKIIVHYNIEDSKDEQIYEVALYSSQDKFSQALRSVSGNGVGSSVSPGTERVIIWDVLKDVSQLTGEF